MLSRLRQILICVSATIGLSLSIYCSESEGALELSKGGEAKYAILLPASPTAVDLEAKNELLLHLKKITGLDFVSVSGNGDSLPQEKVISIGRTALGAQTIPENWDIPLGDSGYAVSVKAGNLFLFGGNRRGSLNAVYAFLEDDLGCRWYTWRWEKIPHREDLNISVRSRYSVPAFAELREPLCDSSNHDRWSLRNRTEPLYLNHPVELGGRKVVYTTRWYVHTYDKIAPKNLFGTHPEYFGKEADGSRRDYLRCPSNPGFQKLAIDFALNGLAENPENNYVLIGMCDNYSFCHCEDCLRAGVEGGSTSTAHMNLVNMVAKEVAAKYPKAKVVTLAYHATGMPPKNLKLEPNVVIWLCTDCLPSEKRQVPIYKNDVFVKRMQAWRPVAPEIHIWDYQVTFRNYLRYDTTFYSMSQNLRYYASQKVTGVQLQGALASSGEREGMRAWVFAKLMWNPGLDPLNLMKDYCTGVFGAAGEKLYPFYKELFMLGKNGKRLDDAEDSIRKKGLAAFGAAYRKLAAGGNDPEILARLDLESLPMMIMQLEHMAEILEGNAGMKKAEKQRTEYDQLYKKVKRVCETEKIRYYKEGGAVKGLLAKLQLWDFEKFPRELQPGSMLISAAKGKISWWSGPSFQEDENSGSGCSLALPYTKAEYPVRWYSADYSKLEKGGRFTLSIRCRADSAEAGKEIIAVGFYNKKTGFKTFREIKGSEIGPEYRWIDCGRFAFPPGYGYLYAFAKSANEAKNVRLDALEIHPYK